MTEKVMGMIWDYSSTADRFGQSADSLVTIINITVASKQTVDPFNDISTTGRDSHEETLSN